MPFRGFYSGSAYAVLAYERDNGSCQVQEYLEGLPNRDRKRMTALLELAAENGPPRNSEKSAAIENFFEFKAYQTRIFYDYLPGKRIVLFYGFTKKRNKTPNNVIATGRSLCQEVRDEDRRSRG